jgi:hypothetical protein
MMLYNVSVTKLLQKSIQMSPKCSTEDVVSHSCERHLLYSLQCHMHTEPLTKAKQRHLFTVNAAKSDDVQINVV